MSPRRSKRRVVPSGERSTDTHVPSLTVKLTFLASGRGLLMSSAGSNFFFAAVCAETEIVRNIVAMSNRFKAGLLRSWRLSAPARFQKKLFVTAAHPPIDSVRPSFGPIRITFHLRTYALPSLWQDRHGSTNRMND